MWGRGLIGAVAIVTVFHVTLPASIAQSAPPVRHRQTIIQPARYSSLQLQGTHGYEVDVSTVGSDQLVVQLFSGVDYLSYLVPATLIGNRVEAKIGNLGRIQMQFKPSEPWRKSSEPQGACRGRRPLGQHGFFTGTFSFRGEHGFTVARSRRAAAYREDSFREVCKGGGRNGFRETGPLKPDLTADAVQGDRAISVELFLGPEQLSTDADILEKRPGLLIERSIGTASEASRYAPQAGGSALITPPPPFTGEVTYRPEALGGDPWTGALAAPFPGLGVVRLAGPSYAVSHSGSR